MSEKLISRRGAFSLLGLAAALALPTTALTTSDAEAQAPPTAPAPTAPTMSGMQQGQEQQTRQKQRHEAPIGFCGK